MDMKFLVKSGDIRKIEQSIPSALVFLVIKMKKNIQSLYQKIVVTKNILI